MTMTFLQFLKMNEDAASNVAQLQRQITDIDTQINQRTKPLVDQKMRKQAMLAVAQKQLDDQLQQDQTQQSENPNQQTQQTTTTTPGSTGQSTPGVSGSSSIG